MTNIEEKSGVEVVMQREHVELRSVYEGTECLRIGWGDGFACHDSDEALEAALHIQKLMAHNGLDRRAI